MTRQQSVDVFFDLVILPVVLVALVVKIWRAA